jgi:hypothetical protein
MPDHPLAFCIDVRFPRFANHPAKRDTPETKRPVAKSES